MSRIRLEVINALAELQRMDWKYEPVSEDEVKCKCPVHDDKVPSVALNVRKMLWKCHACDAKGDFISFLAYALKVERGTVIVDLSSRYDLQDAKQINPAVVEKFHEQIWNAGPLLAALRARGVTDDMIRKARLGYHFGRITIPIYDQQGRIINVRRYLPGAPTSEKMQNTKGYGTAALYQVDQLLKYEKLWLCGGEMKALVTGTMLNEIGMGAFCVSAGEGAWNHKWNSLLKGKDIYVCMDVDAAGKAASRKVAGYIVEAARSVHVIHLPLDIVKYPKGDINDYVGREKASLQDLVRLMDEAKQFESQYVEAADSKEEIKLVALGRATDSENVNRRVSFEAIVVAMDTTPYLVPKKVSVSCSRDQPQCHQCPVHLRDPDPDSGLTEMLVPATSIGLLDMINAPKKMQYDGLHTALRIPTCKVVGFNVKEHYNVRDVRLSPQLTIGQDTTQNVVQPAFCVGEIVELNTPYRFTGVVYPHPKNQQAVIIVNQAEEVADSLTRFAPCDNDLKELEVFQPKDWKVESIAEKLSEIYADFEANVTRIFERRDLHLVMDFAFFSPLIFEFDGKLATGWTNALIMGDSSQGKSEVSTRIMEHYGLGERVECKNASVAGLLGGLQQLGNRWFVSWGVIPTHDRRLVVLEEVKGASTEVIGKLTDMRSSGIAEIPKIERRRAHARTRLVFISNPRGNRPMSAYNFGVDAVKELIGNLEDIRRFDIALIVSSDEIDASLINRLSKIRPRCEHRFTRELCRRLVLWSWTRRIDQVSFDDMALDATLEHSTRLCSKYSEELPLVDRGTIRFKIARLASSLAARLFSHKDLKTIRVRASHVEFVAAKLDQIYSGSVFGYQDFSEAQTLADKLIDPDIVRRQLINTRYPKDLIRQLLYRNEFTVFDFCDWLECDRNAAQKFMSFLVRKHAIFREKLDYRKTSDFIRLLKKLEAEPINQEAEMKEEY